MNIRSFRPVLEMLLFSVAAFLMHWLVFYFFLPLEERKFHFPLWIVYAFFTGCAVIVTAISLVVREFNIHSVGQAFMLSTFLEMFACFAIFYAKLSPSGSNSSIERANFIIVFLLFLAIETFVTIRLLNKKQ